MEGLVGQQQLLIRKWVELLNVAGSGGIKGVAEGQEEVKEPQGEDSGGQEDETEGALGEGLGGAPEDALGNELENGTEVEDGMGEDGQKSKAKGKSKERELK
ncbi:hypothetical protein ID866_11692 [Astraeus odoratus]|nr:hypothetical protein ID866_11692 [Astraeus odoratus]